MAVRLEHANLTVRDIEGMIRFLQTAFPEFRVRGSNSTSLIPNSYFRFPVRLFPACREGP